MIVRRLATAAVAAVAVAGAVSACAPTSTGRTGGPSSQPSSTQSAAGKPTKAKPADAPAEDSRVRKIGQPYVYTDGVQMIVTSVTRWQHTDPEPGKAYVCVTVKVTNGSKKIIDLGMAQIHLRTGADGASTDIIGDSAKGVMGTMDAGSVAPTRAQTIRTAFSMPTGTSLALYSVELAPTFDHEPVIFEGSLK